MIKQFLIKSTIIMMFIMNTISAWDGGFDWYPGASWFQPMPEPDVVLTTQVLTEKQKKYAISYPNPIYLSKRNQQPVLFYWLEKDRNIEILIYNSIGSLLGKKRILKGNSGAQANIINEVILGPQQLNLYHITPGVYFYLIYDTDENKMLYKGKIGVQP